MASGIACLREKDTLLSHCIFPPKTLNRNWEISMETHQGRATTVTRGLLLLRNFQCLPALPTSLLCLPFLPSSISPLLLCCIHPFFPLFFPTLSLSFPSFLSLHFSLLHPPLPLSPSYLAPSISSFLPHSLSSLLPVPYPFYLLS